MAIIYGAPKKYTPSQSRVKNQIKKSVNLFLLDNTDEYGKISNPQVYYQAIEALKPYESDADIQIKMAQYRNKALVLETKIEKVKGDVLFEGMALKGRLAEALRLDFKNPDALIERWADVYSAALMDNSVALNSAYGKPIPLPSEIKALTKYREKLEYDARAIIDLDSYRRQGTSPPYPEAYAVYIRTNPQTGSVNDIQIKTFDSVEAKNTGFERTDLKFSGIPIYTNAFYERDKILGRIGDIKLAWNEGQKILKRPALGKFVKGLKFETLGIKFLKLLEPELFEEETERELEIMGNELPLEEFRYAPSEIPLGSIIQDDRENYWYLDNENEVWDIGNEVDADLFLKATDRRENLAALTYPVSSDFIKEKSKIGREKVIDRSLLTRITTPTRPTEPTSIIPSLKGGRVYGKKLSPEMPEFAGGEYIGPKVLAKGERIFKGV